VQAFNEGVKWGCRRFQTLVCGKLERSKMKIEICKDKEKGKPDGLMIVPETEFESQLLTSSFHLGLTYKAFIKCGLTPKEVLGLKIPQTPKHEKMFDKCDMAKNVRSNIVDLLGAVTDMTGKEIKENVDKFMRETGLESEEVQHLTEVMEEMKNTKVFTTENTPS